MSSVRCGPCGDPCSWEVGEADWTAPFWLHVYVGYHKFYSWCNDAVPWFMLARQHQPLPRKIIFVRWRCFKRDAETSSWLNPVALQSLWANDTGTGLDESNTHHRCTGKPVCIATVQGQQHYCSDYLGCVHMKGTSNFLLSFSNNFRLLVTARLMHRL